MSPFRRRARRLTVTERALLSSTALLALILVLLVITPVTVSAPIRAGELAILVVAFFFLLALNVVNVNRTLAPLSRFAAQMRDVDLVRGERVAIDPADETPELVGLADSFNEVLARLRQERRAGSRAALLAQERERRRVAAALHDEAGQNLTAVALELERVAADGQGVDAERARALADQLHDTLDEVRRIARELRPEALDDLGLVNALIALSSRVGKQGGIRVERSLGPQLPVMSEEVELVIYRVAQEALTNVLRHSRARRCLIRLTADEEVLTLTVADDGIGMPESVHAETLGIEGMRERAMLVGGWVSVGAGPEGGTTVTFRIPLAGA